MDRTWVGRQCLNFAAGLALDTKPHHGTITEGSVDHWWP